MGSSEPITSEPRRHPEHTVIHYRSILASTIVGVVLLSACGSDDASTTSDSIGSQPVADESTATELTQAKLPATTAPPTSTEPPTTAAPPTTAPAADAAEMADHDSVAELTHDEAEMLQAAMGAAATAKDPAAFRLALGASGAFVGLDGTRSAGDDLERFLTNAWAGDFVYRDPTELVPGPRGFAYTVEVTNADGTVTQLGLALTRNDAGGFDVLQFDPLVREVLDAAPDVSGLDEAEALAIAEGVLGTFEDEDFAQAADVLGPDGAYVEASLVVSAPDVPAFFASFSTIERIDVTGPGVATFGGYAFPITETHGDGSANAYEVIVTTDADGALRLVWLMPSEVEWLMANSRD
jgi:hypothetical protein